MGHDRAATVLWSWEYADAQHPRPGEVQLLEAFLNTVDHHRFGGHATKPDDERDLFATASGLKQWLRSHGWADVGVVDNEAVARARGVRDVLRELLSRRQGGTGGARAAAPRVSLPSGLHLEVQLDGHTPQLVPLASGVDDALAQLLADLVVAQATGSLERLKICAADDCRFVYYDHSRSRTSRWCSTSTCGNRIKTRRYRQRRS